MASYTIAYYPVLILTAGLLWLIYLLVTAQFQEVLNLFISNFPGVITEQTANAAAFPVMILMGAPVVLLIAIAFWAIVRGMGGSN